MTAGPLVVDLGGHALTAEEKDLLAHPSVGGVILFARNIESYEQLTDLTRQIGELRPELLICVDQEGGRVQRCKDGFTRLPPMQSFDRLYSTDRDYALQLACDCGWLLAAEIIAAGMDFSFAPVLDVDDNHSSVIGDRSFSSRVQRVVELAGAFVDGAHQAGMAVTGKHFPGHGAVVADSHLELPIDRRSLDQIRNSDMIPFAVLLPRLDAVMPAHILFPEVDSCPVGFSDFWLQHILRGEMAFQGLVFSDDLSMAGAAAAGSYLQRVESALGAGCDMALMCNNPSAARQVVNTLHPRFYTGAAVDRSVMKAACRHDGTALRRDVRWRKTALELARLVDK